MTSLFTTKVGRGINPVLLVGGYAESSMLAHAIREMFSKKRIIIPQEAAWSVLRGAVIFGHDSSLIRERVSKYTYGIAVDEYFDPKIHDEKHKEEVYGKIRCKGLFSKHVTIDEAITVGEYQTNRRYTTEGGNFIVKIFTSTQPNHMYVDEDGCSSIGEILFDDKEHKGDIRVQMMFSNTEIEVKVILVGTNKNKKLFLKQ